MEGAPHHTPCPENTLADGSLMRRRNAPAAAPSSSIAVLSFLAPCCLQCRMGDLAGVRNMIKGGEADLLAPSETLRKWTPLQICCWGTMKPANDKDLVEALLMWAMKKGKPTEEEMRAAAECAPAHFGRTLLRPPSAARPSRRSHRLLPSPLSPVQS